MPIHAAFLKYFAEVCRTGSIRAAARNLHVASSAVNRQILKAENELGAALFERSPAGIALTEAGELLARHVEHTLTDYERTLKAVAAVAQQHQRRIVIAGQESVIARFLPPALLAIHSAYPDIATSFIAASGTQLSQMLLSGGADVALAFDPRPDTGIQQFSSRRLPVGAIVAPDHPLARCATVTLADCISYPLVLPDRSWPLRELLDREIAGAGVEPRVLTTSNSVEFLRSMLDQHLGIGFQTVVGIEAELEKGLLQHIPLHNPGPVSQVLAVCARANRRDWAPLQSVIERLGETLMDYGTAPDK